MVPMVDAPVRRRGHGEDAVYFVADKNRYIDAASLGLGPAGKRLRRKVSGQAAGPARGAQRRPAVFGGIHSLGGGG